MSASTPNNIVNAGNVEKKLSEDFQPWEAKSVDYSCAAGTFKVTVKTSGHRTDSVIGLFLLANMSHPATVPCHLSNPECERQHSKMVTVPIPVPRQFNKATMDVQFSDGCRSSAIAEKVRSYAEKFNQRCGPGLSMIGTQAPNLIAFMDTDGTVRPLQPGLALKLDHIISR